MTLHRLPEPTPRIRRQLCDFMTTAQFEQLKASPKAEDRPKGRK